MALASKITTITPELASTWLESNEGNRHLRDRTVEQYARDLKNGNFGFSESAFVLGEDGTLLNGQHRATAVVQTGIPLPNQIVVTGAPTESRDTMDSGMGRTPGDMLAIRGENYANELAAAARFCVNYERNVLYAETIYQKVSKPEVRDFIDAHPDIRDSVLIAKKYAKDIGFSTTVVAAAHWIISKTNSHDAVDEFFEKCALKNNLELGSPILGMTQRIARMKNQRVFYSTRERVYLLVKVWNLYAKGVSDAAPQHFAMPPFTARGRSLPQRYHIPAPLILQHKQKVSA